MSLNADHRDVCKFTSQEDPSYVCVRNALQNLVTNLCIKGMFCPFWKEIPVHSSLLTPSKYWVQIPWEASFQMKTN